MAASFYDPEIGTVTRRQAVTIVTRHFSRKAWAWQVKEIAIQPCDVCGSVTSPFWGFLISGQAFTFCEHHRQIGARYHGDRRLSDQDDPQGRLL